MPPYRERAQLSLLLLRAMSSPSDYLVTASRGLVEEALRCPVPTISYTPGCSLKSQHPCLSMHACQEAFGLSQAACCGASNAYQGQSVLLRAHERSLSAASVTTAHRVCGKRSWPLLCWPALSFGTSVAGMRTANQGLGPGAEEISPPASHFLERDLRPDSNHCSWAIAAGAYNP